jgi:hypothetical protein
MVGAGLDRWWWPGMMAKSDRVGLWLCTAQLQSRQISFLDGIMKFSTKDKVYIARAR